MKKNFNIAILVVWVLFVANVIVLGYGAKNIDFTLTAYAKTPLNSHTPHTQPLSESTHTKKATVFSYTALTQLNDLSTHTQLETTCIKKETTNEILSHHQLTIPTQYNESIVVPDTDQDEIVETHWNESLSNDVASFVKLCDMFPEDSVLAFYKNVPPYLYEDAPCCGEKEETDSKMLSLSNALMVFCRNMICAGNEKDDVALMVSGLDQKIMDYYEEKYPGCGADCYQMLFEATSDTDVACLIEEYKRNISFSP